MSFEGSNLTELDRSSNNDDQPESEYQDAAIFLEEGLDNDKFNSHPKTKEEYVAFRRCHNKVYYTIELLPPLFLMLMALLEKPATIRGLPIWLKCLLELLLMGVIIVLMAMRGMWLGWRKMFRQRRTVMKAVVIAALMIDAFVEMVHNSHHGRFLRALRPLFLFDVYYLAGLRRYTICHI
jgi:two pore calcium channel protein 1